ncbi:MAG: alanine dehydrogenase [Maribacter sp.]|jgi:alanine dehydrogenase
MSKRYSYSSIFTASELQPQEEVLAVMRQKKKLYIGIPKESSFQENRVALVPASVATLIAYGHRVVVEKDAGEKSNYADQEYSEAGAEIAYSPETVFEADVIIMVAPPSMEEMDYFKPNQIIVSPIHLPTITPEYINKLKQKRVIALAWEYIKDQVGSFPFVRIISEIAGISAMLAAGEILSNTNGGQGVLLGGITGVPPSKVVILGAGVVAEYATRTALGLGADVRIFDDNIHKMMRLQHLLGRRLYTSTINSSALIKELSDADVVIGAIHSSTGRTPVVVSEDMVAKMKAGSVIIDVSIDQGGCFATSRVTTHDNPTFREYGVIHYCVPNIASRVSQTASLAVSNILTPILLQAEHTGNIERLIYDNIGLRHGVYAYKGCLTNEYLGEKFQIKSTDLNLLLSSNL